MSNDISQHLVDSNVVLTTAGLKPHTEFFVDIKGEEDMVGVEAQVAKLNDLLKSVNTEIRFYAVKKPLVSARRSMCQMVSVESLLGVERVSKTSKIPGVFPFDRKTGWQGYKKWKSQLMKNFGAAQHAGTAPFTDDDAYMNVLGGLLKGYPDTAIYDFTEWSPTDRSRDMQDSEIPFSGTYKEAEPNYDFYPEHANNSDIQENIRQAGKILQDFYQSGWHKSMAEQLEFHKRKQNE